MPNPHNSKLVTLIPELYGTPVSPKSLNAVGNICNYFQLDPQQPAYGSSVQGTFEQIVVFKYFFNRLNGILDFYTRNKLIMNNKSKIIPNPFKNGKIYLP